MIHRRLLPIDIIERAERLDRGESEESIMTEEEIRWRWERYKEQEERISLFESFRLALLIDAAVFAIVWLIAFLIRGY